MTGCQNRKAFWSRTKDAAFLNCRSVCRTIGISWCPGELSILQHQLICRIVARFFRVSIAFRHVGSLYPDTPWDLSWNLQPDDTSGAHTIKIVAQSVATCSNFRSQFGAIATPGHCGTPSHFVACEVVITAMWSLAVSGLVSRRAAVAVGEESCSLGYWLHSPASWTAPFLES